MPRPVGGESLPRERKLFLSDVLVSANEYSLWGIPIPAHTTALSFFDGYRTETLPANLIQAQRDFFGAHTFRVQPGFENDDMKAGQDIHVKWTATSGNVRISYHYTLIETDETGLLVYLQRLECFVEGFKWISIGERLCVEEYGYETCRLFMVWRGIQLPSTDLIPLSGFLSSKEISQEPKE